jgi:hypothetical protein
MSEVLSSDTMSALDALASEIQTSGTYVSESELSCGCTGDCGQSCHGGCEAGCSGDCGRSCSGSGS